ncbi:hypothetical protein [Bradyrhizobium glycinis]|uniref:hypothetical protein n=1 Tax=Bradyrhizobium glycinis TaxID=2751812 RepID=UPI0018D7964F|nr:hypothetical protein [Bradyrhizobium glycinis]MBH5371598.1 hypothetical protein [Bradyrhizobium glycinis]
MTQEQKVIRAKVGMLELAKQLGDVSQACRMMVSAHFTAQAARRWRRRGVTTGRGAIIGTAWLT